MLTISTKSKYSGTAKEGSSNRAYETISKVEKEAYRRGEGTRDQGCSRADNVFGQYQQKG